MEKMMGLWDRIFGDESARIDSLETAVIDLRKKGTKTMTAITELATVVDAITETTKAHADEVRVAIDELNAAVAAAEAAKSDPAIQAAVDKLTGVHTVLAKSAADLKAAVDAVSASGGKATA